MVRIFTALLLIILVSSHGTMGAAAPHLHGSGVTHHDDHAATTIALADDAAPSQSDDYAQDKAAGHVHCVADIAHPAGFVAVARVVKTAQHLSANQFAPPAAAIDPLLEPPSA